MTQQTKTKLLQTIEQFQLLLDSLRVTILDELQSPDTKPTTARSRLHIADSLPANRLGPLPDHTNPAWPMAVQPQAIVVSDSEKQFRALQVARLLRTNLTNLTVLDAGCGDGYIASELANQAQTVVGYDLRPDPNWDKLSNAVVSYTTNRVVVETHKYDLIVLYDVLDHLEAEDPVKFMTWLNSLLAPTGRAFVRTHPWTSRHGGHQYEYGCNKAYVHLALTPDELAKAGITLMPSLRINRPMAVYEQIFKEANFRVTERWTHVDQVEPFFIGEALNRIQQVTWRGNITAEGALKILTNQFIDYELVIMD